MIVNSKKKCYNILRRNIMQKRSELREKCIKWVEWANKVDPSEYDPFANLNKN